MMMKVVTMIMVTMTMRMMSSEFSKITLSPAILLKAYTYKYVTMQSIEILLKKIYGTKKSCRTFSMAATPSCSCAERWTATPPSPAIRLKSFWSQKLQAFQKSISLTSTISNKTLKLLHCLGHLRVLQKIHEYRFGFVKTPSN